MVDNAIQADWVRQNPTEWFNADFGTPSHSYEPDELEVVEVQIKVQVTIDSVDTRAPTPYEYFKMKYEKKEPAHWKYLQELMSIDEHGVLTFKRVNRDYTKTYLQYGAQLSEGEMSEIVELVLSNEFFNLPEDLSTTGVLDGSESYIEVTYKSQNHKCGGYMVSDENYKNIEYKLWELKEYYRPEY